MRPTFERENDLAAQHFRRVAGVDEAGRGPLAGPVVAAAVILPSGFDTRFAALAARLDDSKKLSAAVRETLFEELVSVVEYGIGLVNAPVIDEINIRQASWRAMQHAVADLESRARTALIRPDGERPNDEATHRMSTHAASEKVLAKDFSVNGETASEEAASKEAANKRNASKKSLTVAFEWSWEVDYVLIDGLPYGPGPWPYEAIVKGDGKSLSIAAASILAKETRDKVMREMDAVYPQYGFAQHKGYGSGQHLRALAEHGPCAIHRLSFAPVKNALLSCVEKKALA